MKMSELSGDNYQDDFESMLSIPEEIENVSVSVPEIESSDESEGNQSSSQPSLPSQLSKLQGGAVSPASRDSEDNLLSVAGESALEELELGHFSQTKNELQSDEEPASPQYSSAVEQYGEDAEDISDSLNGGDISNSNAESPTGVRVRSSNNPPVPISVPNPRSVSEEVAWIEEREYGTNQASEATSEQSKDEDSMTGDPKGDEGVGDLPSSRSSDVNQISTLSSVTPTHIESPNEQQNTAATFAPQSPPASLAPAELEYSSDFTSMSTGLYKSDFESMSFSVPSLNESLVEDHTALVSLSPQCPHLSPPISYNPD